MEYQNSSLFIAFCEDNGMNCSVHDAELLIAQYDENGNNKLCFSEFNQLLLPTTDETLRLMASTRTGFDNKARMTTLTPKVEEILTKVILHELDFQRRTEAIKIDLNARYDFTRKAAFDLLNTMEPKDRIDRCEIRQFVDNHLRWLSEAELDAIIRRCDTDGDEALTYVEFSEMIRGIKPELYATRHNTRKNINYTKEHQKESYSSPPREHISRKITTTHYHSPHRSPRHESPCEIRVTTHHSPTRHLHSHYYHSHSHYNRDSAVKSHNHISPYKSAEKRSPERSYTAYKPSQDHKSDYKNSQAALRMRSLRDSPVKHSHTSRRSPVRVEIEDRKYRSPVKIEVEETKYRSPICHSPVHHSPVHHHSAMYHSPSKVISTTTFHHGHVHSTHTHIHKASPMKGYEEEEFVESLKELIRLETGLEKAKQLLSHRRDFTLNDAFKIFDISSLNRVTSSDIKKVYDEHNIYISHDEAELILSRYDRDRDERLTYEEFADMFVPIDRVFSTSLDLRSHKYPNGYYATRYISDSITRNNFTEVLK